MDAIAKKEAYETALKQIDAVLEGETQMTVKMVTINCLLKEHLPYYFWVGFYCVHNGALMVGPYQGTLGCLHIPFGKGICGRAARELKTQLIEDVHADPEHLACDSRTMSEVVVPVLDAAGKLLAVFDVDSTDLASFDKTDVYYLEALLHKQFSVNKLELSYAHV